MATVNTLESKNSKDKGKMHFTCSLALLATLGTFKLPLKGVSEIIVTSSSLKNVLSNSLLACFQAFLTY